MPNYRRYRVLGGAYFFTVNLLERCSNNLLINHVESLRTVVRETRKRWPFQIDAWVVLPDHLHCVWTLPEGDDDNSNRWRLIKQGFSKALPMTERRSAVRVARGERGARNAVFGIMSSGTAAHVDYCHINPAKQGLVGRVSNWPCSSFHR